MICGKCRRKMNYLKDLSIPKRKVLVYLCEHCYRLEIVKPLDLHTIRLLPGGIIRLRLELKKLELSLPPF